MGSPSVGWLRDWAKMGDLRTPKTGDDSLHDLGEQLELFAETEEAPGPNPFVNAQGVAVSDDDVPF
jgi:hypothetical protein